MTNFLLEIGTEEIPAGYIEPALKALSSKLLQKMSRARIEHGQASTFGTPRRLAIVVENIAEKQQTVTTEVLGPPKKIGFDENGKPTVAAKKFAEKIGVPMHKIKIKETKKGSYLSVQKTDRGLATHTLLKGFLADVILAIPFPKTMRWADHQIEFARPIHSIVALLKDKVVPFNLGFIKSGRYTMGHSFMQPQRIRLSDSNQYIKSLEAAWVLADIQKRRQRIEQEITTAAKRLGGRGLPDEALLDIVTHLVEYPVASGGKFDQIFLELPREILITAMREHQKYFAVIDEKDRLMPCFIALNNTLTKDMELVSTGHERVLRARLADAQFFYKSDLGESFESWVNKLKGVRFQAQLGTVYEKVVRIKKLAGFLAGLTAKEPKLKKRVLRAALLCKTDLVSQVVGEFPTLQGVMGRVYATVRKEDDQVATAIEEHHRPTFSGGPLPQTATGAILSIADKIDNICGCFGVGLIPTGASDPYALRRQGIGIVQIMLNQGFTYSLKGMIEKDVKLFGARSVKEIRETTAKVYTFIKNRLAHQLEEEGYSKDVIAAVIDVSIDNIPEVWQRVRALENLKAQADFEPLAVAFKRVVNIIKQAGVFKTRKEISDINEKLFQHKSESDLYKAYKTVSKKVSTNLNRGRFERALLDIASMRNKVDTFFDNVMVMDEDSQLRRNRLALLGHIASLFSKFADFSKIST